MYTPRRNTLLTNRNYVQRADGDDSCRPLVTNHKEIHMLVVKHNAVNRSAKLINSPLYQTLWANKPTDSSAKDACASQSEVHQ
jgi:hypothetical protein